MLRPDSGDVEEAAAAIGAATARVPEGIRAAVVAEEPNWQQALTAKASTAQERRLIVSGARIDVDGDGVTLLTGTGGRLSGGLTSPVPIEYGSSAKQFRPRLPSGYVAGPASLAVQPEIEKAMANGFVEAFAGDFEIEKE